MDGRSNTAFNTPFDVMPRYGLALSGGGFRASLYHLGVLRFMRDAGLLQQVSHITSVSGGSIIAAHLVMNWDRYNGNEQEFDKASEELLAFIRMDVRNRVVRRFPFAFLANGLRSLTGQKRSRRLTRPGLLEAHYENHLYGDTCLFELPITPQLHMLATDVNEGCLSSFTRKGLLLQRRMPDGTMQFESVPSALATVPMAVTASSAFPGFFPPLQLNASDVGADASQFPTHLFTDGGVYDNLGVRMFRWIRKSWIGHDSPLREDDFCDIEEAAKQFDRLSKADDNTPIHRLAQLIRERIPVDNSIDVASLSTALWSVISHQSLYQEPVFESLPCDDTQAEDLLRLGRHGRKLDKGDHLWLNRYLVNCAYTNSVGSALLHNIDPTFDAVIVSDAGKKFSVSRRTKGGGLVGTAMRATDILMNRVWQLENDHFHADPDFIFAPMDTQVHPGEDPHALHPEIQRQVTSTRTDLDKFSELEISGLVRHGYCVMRKTCRSHPEQFGDSLPSGSAWDPTSLSDEMPPEKQSPSQTATRARTLQRSSQRKIFGGLLNFRDWPTYLFIPILLLLCIGFPYWLFQRYQESQRTEMIVDAITYSNPDFQLVLEIARERPVPGNWRKVEISQVESLPPIDHTGFRMITDTRVIDTRAWDPDDETENTRIVSYRRMQVRRVIDPGSADTDSLNNHGRFRLQQFDPSSEVFVRSRSSVLEPLMRSAPGQSPSGQDGHIFEADFDLSKVPTGADFDIGFEVTSPGIQGRAERGPRLTFPILAPTDIATMWVFLPPGMPYEDLELVAYQLDSVELVESIDPTYRFDMADGSLFGWMLVAPRTNHMYECRWTWKKD